MEDLIAQGFDFGTVNAPAGVSSYGSFAEFVSNLVKLLIVGAGIFAVFNLVLAGYAFLSAGDDPKRMQGAWAKIWQTFLGLAIAVGAIVLASIFGQLLFGDPNALLQIRVFGPN